MNFLRLHHIFYLISLHQVSIGTYTPPWQLIIYSGIYISLRHPVILYFHSHNLYYGPTSYTPFWPTFILLQHLIFHFNSFYSVPTFYISLLLQHFIFNFCYNILCSTSAPTCYIPLLFQHFIFHFDNLYSVPTFYIPFWQPIFRCSILYSISAPIFYFPIW